MFHLLSSNIVYNSGHGIILCVCASMYWMKLENSASVEKSGMEDLMEY